MAKVVEMQFGGRFGRVKWGLAEEAGGLRARCRKHIKPLRGISIAIVAVAGLLVTCAVGLSGWLCEFTVSFEPCLSVV